MRKSARVGVASSRSRPPGRPGESSGVAIPTPSVAERAGRHAGFTLIEVMVVLVIMGVMATGITIGLDSLRGRDAEQALKRLRLVLEASADRAVVRGRPIAIEFLPDGYRFSALDADDNWRPLIDPPVVWVPIPPVGVSVALAVASEQPCGLDIVRVEAKLWAAYNWMRTILGTILDYGPYVANCTPGYLNNEGHSPRNVLAALRSMSYMASALDWLRYLESWREEGKMRGLEFVRRSR